jgi:hypothetical protein
MGCRSRRSSKHDADRVQHVDGDRHHGRRRHAAQRLRGARWFDISVESYIGSARMQTRTKCRNIVIGSAHTTMPTAQAIGMVMVNVSTMPADMGVLIYAAGVGSIFRRGLHRQRQMQTNAWVNSPARLAPHHPRCRAAGDQHHGVQHASMGAGMVASLYGEPAGASMCSRPQVWK